MYYVKRIYWYLVVLSVVVYSIFWSLTTNPAFGLSAQLPEALQGDETESPEELV